MQMIKHRRMHKLDLKQETIRVLSNRRVALVVGGTVGGSDPSNTVSGDDCSGSIQDPSLAGHGCLHTL
jgi:hypothetical protein